MIRSAYRGSLFTLPKIYPKLLAKQFGNKVPTMKRKAGSSPEPPRKVVKLTDYCSTPTRRDSEGAEIWPAPETQIVAAREFLLKWSVFEPREACSARASS